MMSKLSFATIHWKHPGSYRSQARARRVFGVPPRNISRVLRRLSLGSAKATGADRQGVLELYDVTKSSFVAEAGCESVAEVLVPDKGGGLRMEDTIRHAPDRRHMDRVYSRRARGRREVVQSGVQLPIGH